MGPQIAAVETSSDFPAATSVVVIGGGIIGLSTALVLAERCIPVVVLEKGRIAGEQSSRNLGWVRKTIRERSDLPLAIESERLWCDMSQRVGSDVGYRQSGIMYLARTEQEMGYYRNWLNAAADFSLDSRLLAPSEIDDLAPGGTGGWAGGIYTASDGRAEPTLAASAMARAAMMRGASIVENCAVRTLSMTGGHVSGVVTERGEIRCEKVILAGGIWSRRFLGNLGVALPTLPAVASVLRTKPMDGPTDIAVGAPDFSFRKGVDGSYTITQRAAFKVPLIIDSLLIGHRYLGAIKAQWGNMRISVGRELLDDLALRRRWGASGPSPFEQLRTKDPLVDDALIDEAMRNVSRAWPTFNNAEIALTWAGMIDVTPDSLPVISLVSELPGLILAGGFSGHGFGTAPAAGQLAADLATGASPIVDPHPYRLERLAKASRQASSS